MYVVDTDHLGVLQRASDPAYSVLSRRISQHAQTDFYVTIVSFHEQILGWNAYIARAKDQGGVVRGCRRLEAILADFSRAQVLPFDDQAAEVFDVLRRQRIRIGTMDLRIAAIPRSKNMTVLTRNLVDFQRVPVPASAGSRGRRLDHLTVRPVPRFLAPRSPLPALCSPTAIRGIISASDRRRSRLWPH